ncbi:MAG: cellulase [Verrucomicrobia bacterium]|nr:cellulase [Verrucomicrobiota bacterium]MCH8512580.1 cellulase [Kiritimatiellia bacterium]
MTELTRSTIKPLAITMWDFSWLERRWPGSGFEDWGQALDELLERGYNAVRIDAYPHLILRDPAAEYELIPVWSVNDWGSPMRCRVQVMPALTDFISACAKRKIKVLLSSWFRRDTGQSWRMLFNPKLHALAWSRTLNLIRDAGLMDTILGLDICNEWPIPIWAPYVYGEDEDLAAGTGPKSYTWDDPRALNWANETMDRIRQEYPAMPLTFSTQMDGDWGKAVNCDFWEPHIWMVGGEFYNRLQWTFTHKFDHSEFERVQLYARDLYQADPAHWQNILRGSIENMAAHARSHGKVLMTTECWGIVDYKDGPMLDWDWVMELCALGTEISAQSGSWAAIGTSNFCAPQFVGMWRDVAWHQRLTKLIKSSPIQVPLSADLATRMAGAAG